MIEQRFDDRNTMALRFIGAYTAQVMANEERLAKRVLGGAVGAARFDEIVQQNQFNAAVLLDARGVLLEVSPTNPTMLKTPIGQRYAHMRSAVAGTPAVSDVVASASERRPLIAFAVPYETSSGRGTGSAWGRSDAATT